MGTCAREPVTGPRITFTIVRFWEEVGNNVDHNLAPLLPMNHALMNAGSGMMIITGVTHLEEDHGPTAHHLSYSKID